MQHTKIDQIELPASILKQVRPGGPVELFTYGGRDAIGASVFSDDFEGDAATEEQEAYFRALGEQQQRDEARAKAIPLALGGVAVFALWMMARKR